MMIVPKCNNLGHKKSSRRSGSVESTTAYSLVVKRSFRVDLYAPKVHNYFFTATHCRGNLLTVDSRTKCNREEERGEKFERGDVVMFLPGPIVE